MKKAIVILVAFAFVISATAPLFAALPQPIDKSVTKITDGAKDILGVPFDLGKTGYTAIKDHHFKPFALVGKLMKGIGDGTMKAVGGAVKIATFPVD